LPCVRCDMMAAKSSPTDAVVREKERLSTCGPRSLVRYSAAGVPLTCGLTLPASTSLAMAARSLLLRG
jgi:hypothetical protein